MRTDTRVVLLGVGIAACLFLVRWSEDVVEDIPRFLAIMVGAFAFYFAALLVLRRSGVSLPARWIVAVAVLVQLAPFGGTPLWDHDAYRYHWDGMLLARGVNPYKYCPSDHALVNYRDDYWERVDYKWIKTIYPPATQLLLAGTYFLDATPRRVLVLAMAFNLLTLWPLLLLLRERGVDEKWLAIYAWNPLVANEFALGGHLDAIAVFPLLGALYCLARSRGGWAGALMALSVMGKTHMLLPAVLVLRRCGPRGIAAFVLVCAALALPFANAGTGDLLSGTLAYARQWENNSGAFAVLRGLLGSDVARATTAVLVIALTVWLTFRRGDVILHTALVLGTLLLLSPTFFPWYISWVLPFACFYRSATCVILTLLLLAPYVYHYEEALGLKVRVVEVVLMYVIGATEYAAWVRSGRRRQPAPTPTSPDTP